MDVHSIDPDELYAATESENVQKVMPIIPKRDNKQRKTAQGIHDHLLATNKKYQSIVSGTGGYESQSEADMAFCNLVTLETTDPQIIDTVYRLTSLPRDKWDEKRGNSTYGRITIDKAIADSIDSPPFAPVENEEIDMMLSRFVFMRNGNSVIDLEQKPQHAVMTKPEFDNCFGNMVATGRGMPKITTQWLNNAERKTVLGERYAPDEPIIYDTEGASWFNPFHTPEWQHISGFDKAQPILDHIYFLIPDSKENNIFLCWLAWTVHHPEIRLKFTPLLVAVNHGTGRGFLVHLITRLLGSWNCSHVKMKTLAGKSGDGQYHNYLYKTLFCSLPEVRVERNQAYEVDDELRDKLTDSPLNLNLKYGRNGTYDIYTNFLLASNHRDSLILTKEDRRIFVVETLAKAKPDNYYDKLYALLEDKEALAQFYWWLKEFSLKKDFNPHAPAPMTPAKMAMIEGGKSELELAFDIMVEDESRDVLRIKDMRQEIKGILIDQGRTAAEAVEYLDQHETPLQALAKKKCVACCNSKKLKIDGRVSKVYAIRNYEKWVNADNDSLRREVSGSILSG